MDYVAKSNNLKQSQIQEYVDLLKSYPIVGVVNMEGLPTPQLQTMREKLRSGVVLKVGKKRLIKLAIESVKSEKPGIEDLEQYLKGMPALLFTKDNPFKLFKILKQNKSSAPAKAGQEAPKDVVVKAGPTNFLPGPIIGELGSFGIKTSVTNGKLAIQADTVVAKQGVVISSKLAGILTRLGIAPMEVGLDLMAVYDDGTIYSKSVLDVDEDKVVADIELFAVQAFNLAMNAGILVKETIEPLIGKAGTEAKALAIEIGFLTKETVGDVLAKANAQANALKTKVD